MAVKEHYKMYKDGKHWVFAAITVAAIGLGTAVGQDTLAHADNTTTGAETAQASGNSADPSSTATLQKTVDTPASAEKTDAGDTTTDVTKVGDIDSGNSGESDGSDVAPDEPTSGNQTTQGTGDIANSDVSNNDGTVSEDTGAFSNSSDGAGSSEDAGGDATSADNQSSSEVGQNGSGNTSAWKASEDSTIGDTPDVTSTPVVPDAETNSNVGDTPNTMNFNVDGLGDDESVLPLNVSKLTGCLLYTSPSPRDA